MNKLEYGKALALIETRGFVGAIEAADAMVKTAQVELLGLEKTTGGLVLVRAEGEVAACKAAVEAAKVRAAEVGQVLSAHVIPRPVRGLSGVRAVAAQAGPRATRKPRSRTGKRADVKGGSAVTVSSTAEIPQTAELRRMNVPSLRSLARKVPGLKLKGRAVTLANKDKLISALSAYRNAAEKQQ
ncbi:MAG: BMC domain-containing protein [Gemmatimonadota bacterium]|nr:BMC domain-containing protein [Gemmatimonadota bacterium]